eukprot:scaffold206023_cov36-Tisochrysis_lutea.AAC.4
MLAMLAACSRHFAVHGTMTTLAAGTKCSIAVCAVGCGGWSSVVGGGVCGWGSGAAVAVAD